MVYTNSPTSCPPPVALSAYHKVWVFDAPTHLIGEGGGFFVNLFLAPAGGTGTIVVDITSMGQAVVRPIAVISMTITPVPPEGT